MNLERLLTAEAVFLDRYPGGFSHPDMIAVGKKHRVDQVAELTQTLLARGKFSNRDQWEFLFSPPTLGSFAALLIKMSIR